MAAMVKDSARAGYIAVMLSMAFITAAGAQHMNAPNAPCQSVRSNVDETQCFIAAAETANNNLDRFYMQIREVLNTGERDQLITAERLWLKYRPANCNAERDLYGRGSAAPMVYAACLAADTGARFAELKTMYGWRLKK